MEIAGQKIFIPRNFFFLSRLPSRFDILVIAKGATLTKGTAFELEVQGQRLVLNSKIDLKVGVRYELEKISATEFKIVTERADGKKESSLLQIQERQPPKPDGDASGFFIPDIRSTYNDLLSLKILSDAGKKVERKSDKYVFNLESEFALRGVFVPQAAGKYTLFVSGSAAHKSNIDSLQKLIGEFGVDTIRHVNAAVLDRISAGAVDLQS